MKKFINVLWILSMLSWALPLNVINTIIFIGYLIAWKKKIIGHKFIECRLVIITKADEYFGGVSLGWVVIISKNGGSLIHELGHSLQYALFGIFSYFIIALPSAFRYHYQNYLRKKNFEKYRKLKPYDDIWFEKQATNWGRKIFIGNIELNNI